MSTRPQTLHRVVYLVGLIIAGEAVDDKLTYYKGGLRGRFDYGIDKISSKKRVMAIFYRDAIKNAFRTDLFDYIDVQ